VPSTMVKPGLLNLTIISRGLPRVGGSGFKASSVTSKTDVPLLQSVILAAENARLAIARNCLSISVLYKLFIRTLIEKMNNNRRGQGLTLENLVTENNPLNLNESQRNNTDENENPSQNGGYKRRHRKTHKKGKKHHRRVKKTRGAQVIRRNQ
jgi:hypothetical protein